jgi:hypothetical protein
MVDVQQQIFSHTQAINDLTNAFLQQIQQRDNEIANLQNERQTIINQHTEVHSSCGHTIQTLQHQNSQLTQTVELLTKKLKVAAVHDTLHNETTLHQHQTIVSENGHYHARLQDDGNFVLYDGTDFQATHALWASNTGGVGQGPFKLVQQNDGNLVVYQGNGQPTWSSNTWNSGTAPYRLVIQNDRNLVLYDAGNNAKWASNTNI